MGLTVEKCNTNLEIVNLNPGLTTRRVMLGISLPCTNHSPDHMLDKQTLPYMKITV